MTTASFTQPTGFLYEFGDLLLAATAVLIVLVAVPLFLLYGVTSQPPLVYRGCPENVAAAHSPGQPVTTVTARAKPATPPRAGGLFFALKVHCFTLNAPGGRPGPWAGAP